jgi:F-type H+-transporting ATPase subunit b
MLIDWFTVFAQMINFLVLIALLKHFLYRPVLNAIAAREQRIAQELSAAKNAVAAAKTELAQLTLERQVLQQQREAVLTTAQETALAEQSRVLEQAHVAARRIQEDGRLGAQAEFQQLRGLIVQRTCGEVLDLTRRVVSDLAQDDLQVHMVAVFLRRLRQLDAVQRAPFDLLDASTSWRVRSALPLSATQQQALTTGIVTVFPHATTLTFEVAPSLVCGIVLLAGGYKLTWNTEDYLTQIQQNLLALPQWSEPMVATVSEGS